MLGKRMVGALLVLVGVVAFLWGGVVFVVEATTEPALYSSIAPPTSGDTSLLLIGTALTVAGGIVLLLSSARRFA